MKRDFELIRELLLEAKKVEGAQVFTAPCKKDDPVHIHLVMLENAGIVTITTIGDPSEPTLIYELTWDGHELIDFIGNDADWDRIRRFSLRLEMPISEAMIEWYKSYLLDLL